MLSDKIRNITGQLRRRAQDGSLTVEMFRLALENLDAVVDEVAQLEAAAVPEAARLGDADLADGTVVRLDDCRIERAKFGVISGGGDGA